MNSDIGESALSLVRRISSTVNSGSSVAIIVAGEKVEAGEIVAFGGVTALSVAGAVLGAALKSGHHALIIDCDHSPALNASLIRACGTKTADKIVLVECWDSLSFSTVLAGLRNRILRVSADIIFVAGLTAFFFAEQTPNYESYLIKLADMVASAVVGSGSVGMWTVPAWASIPRASPHRVDLAVASGISKSVSEDSSVTSGQASGSTSSAALHIDSKLSGVGVVRVSRPGIGVCAEQKFLLSKKGALKWLNP